jgi:uncharacterized protein YyaL (SSP411 family)
VKQALAAAVAAAALLAGATGVSVAANDPGKTAQQATRDTLLAAAQSGLADVRRHWWSSKLGWYLDTADRPDLHMPLARLWSAFPLFETLAAVATADPTPANKAALRQFADKAATLYWNPKLVPVGGYEWYPGLRSKISTAYFDDSGWWGLSFVDAYRVTGDPTYLAYAHRAFVFIVGAGWDKRSGGVWWETEHRHKTAEPLAAAVLIGTWLYKVRHKAWYLQQVNKLLRWADAHSFNKARGLYQRNASDATVMDYVQGLMIAAHEELCLVRHDQSLCTKAKQLANAAARAFPQQLNWSPSYDVVYVRWMLDYYRMSGDARWYTLAQVNAQRALANARDSRGLYVRDWNGRYIADTLQHDAATLELLAWAAAARPPS